MSAIRSLYYQRSASGRCLRRKSLTGQMKETQRYRTFFLGSQMVRLGPWFSFKKFFLKWTCLEPSTKFTTLEYERPDTSYELNLFCLGL